MPGSEEGQPNQTPEELRALLRRAAAGGLDVAVHAIGDRAVAEALAAFEETGARGGIEHVQLTTRDDVRRMAELGVRASVQPAHLLDDRDVTERLWPGRVRALLPAALDARRRRRRGARLRRPGLAARPVAGDRGRRAPLRRRARAVAPRAGDHPARGAGRLHRRPGAPSRPATPPTWCCSTPTRSTATRRPGPRRSAAGASPTTSSRPGSTAGWRTGADLGAPAERALTPSGERHLEHELRVLEPVAVQVAQLPDAVAHRLRVDEQLLGDGVAAALVEHPRAQRVGELVGGRGPLVGERGEHPGAEVGPGLGVGGQQQRAEVGVGVDDEPVDPRGVARPRRARSCERAASSHGTVGPTTARRCRAARAPAPERAAGVPVRRHEQQGRAPRGRRARPRWGGGCAGPGRSTACGTCASGSSTALSAAGGSQSARSAAATTASAAAPVTRARASRSRLRCRTRPVLSSSSVWPAALAADSSSM